MLIKAIQAYGGLRYVTDRQLFVFIDVGDAAQKGRRFIADIFHAMGLHAGNVDKIPGSGDFGFGCLLRFYIVLVALEFATQNIHGLMIEMVVNGNFAARLNCEVT